LDNKVLKITNLAENYTKETPKVEHTYKHLKKAFLFLLPSLLLTSIAVYFTVQSVDEKYNMEFTSKCNEISAKISTRLHAHAELLRSGAALFATTEDLSREKWRAFFNASKIERNLPGIQGLGYAVLIPKKELKKHITSIRNQGFSDYYINPIGEREFYTSIIYLEPFNERNLRAFGYDMFTEPTRRKAMEISRDSDVAALSGKVILVQEKDQEIQNGSLMYVPVYRNGMLINTIEQRRKAILGWVYSPYRMNDLMNGILGGLSSNQGPELQLKLYDDTLSPASLIYESKRNHSTKINSLPSQTFSIFMNFHGKNWVLSFSEYSKPMYFLESKVFIVAVSGILINIFLFILFITLINTKRNAIRIADKLTTELKENETKLNAILENSFDALAVHIDGICTMCNIAALKLFGFLNKEMIVGQPIIGVIAPSEQKRIKDYIFRRINGKDAPLIYTTKGIKTDGQIFDLEVSLSTFYHLNKQHVLLILRDISERLQAEAKIISLVSRYQTLLKMASDGIHILNDKGDLIEANNSFCNMLGYTKEEMMSLNVADWDSQLNYEELKAKLKELILIGGIFQTSHRCKNGSIIDVEINGIGITLANHKYLYASARNITERKKLENKKDLDLDRLTKIASRVPGVVYQYLLYPDGKSCFPFASDAIKEIYRVDPEEVREDAKKVFEVIHPDDIDAVSISIKKSAEDLIPWKHEYRVKYKDGVIQWLYGNAIPQKELDGSVLWHGFITNITERKELENELKEYTHQLKRSNEDLENFAYVASHDLKAPLNVVTKIFELIDNGTDTPTSTNKLEYIRMAKKTITQMSGLIKDLLDYSRIGTNQEGFSQVNLNETLEYLLIVLKDKISLNNAKIFIPNLPEIYANKTLINELFLNLLNNALTYFNKNTVEIEIGYLEEKEVYKFYVRDNGIGIQEKNFENIFIIFKRLHTQSEYGGTGIGLALCKRIVDIHKGEIWVTSTFGEGSTFYFTIKKFH
jgi:PAS domain S-box-containing protein